MTNQLLRLVDVVEKKETTAFPRFRSDQDKEKSKAVVTFVSVGDGLFVLFVQACVSLSWS